MVPVLVQQLCRKEQLRVTLLAELSPTATAQALFWCVRPGEGSAELLCADLLIPAGCSGGTGTALLSESKAPGGFSANRINSA